MIEQVKVLNRRLISDERGWFLKAINGTEEQLPTHTGEIYLTKDVQSIGKYLDSQVLKCTYENQNHSILSHKFHQTAMQR